MGEVRQLDYPSIQSQIQFLEGKVLTVIEASITNAGQQKAVKDLIKKMFSEQLSWIADLCFVDLPIKSEDQVRAMGIDTEKVAREAEEVS